MDKQTPRLFRHEQGGPADREAEASDGYIEEIEETLPEPDFVIPTLLEAWNEARAAERRELLRTVVARVDVYPGRPRGRIEIIPR